jgi:hypothetical protein
MRASVNEVVRVAKSLFWLALEENSSTRKQEVMLNRLFLIGVTVGILVAHGIVLYKIDQGARSADAGQVMASRSHRAFW